MFKTPSRAGGQGLRAVGVARRLVTTQRDLRVDSAGADSDHETLAKLQRSATTELPTEPQLWSSGMVAPSSPVWE